MKSTLVFDLTFRVEYVDINGCFSEVNFADNVCDARSFAEEVTEWGAQEVALLDSNDQQYSIH